MLCFIPNLDGKHMHHIYHTEGIILGSRSFGEAGKYYDIFTRELGMVRATAQGVRKISSKLRYVLQDFSYIKVDLVRGKDIWRVTSASKTNELENITKNPEVFKIIFNVSRLLKRLLQGEEKNEELFIDLLKGFSLFDKFNENASVDYLENAEMYVVLKILHHLGYIGGDKNISDLIVSPIAEEMFENVIIHKRIVLAEINKALGETQM